MVLTRAQLAEQRLSNYAEPSGTNASTDVSAMFEHMSAISARLLQAGVRATF